MTVLQTSSTLSNSFMHNNGRKDATFWISERLRRCRRICDSQMTQIRFDGKSVSSVFGQFAVYRQSKFPTKCISVTPTVST